MRGCELGCQWCSCFRPPDRRGQQNFGPERQTIKWKCSSLSFLFGNATIAAAYASTGAVHADEANRPAPPRSTHTHPCCRATKPTFYDADFAVPVLMSSTPGRGLPREGYLPLRCPGQRHPGIQTASGQRGAICVPWPHEPQEQMQNPDTRGSCALGRK